MPSAYSQQALEILRRPDITFQWYIIPFLLIVIFIYSNEIAKGELSTVFAGLALWGQDLINETINGLVFHFTQFAPIWGAPTKTAWLFLMGLNIEITFMFAIMGIGAVKLLPKDKSAKVLGVNNRIFYAVVNSILSVAVECWLNSVNALTWEYTWWNTKFPYLIFLFGYLPFYLMCFYVYDLNDRKKQIKVLGIQWGIVIISLITFGSLGWL